MIIRKATLNDFDAVMDLENSCFKLPYHERQMQYEFNENPINTILVACVEDKVVGFINFMTTFNSATITQIAVNNNYRKQGIGTILLNEMEKTFPKNGEDVVEFVTLEVRKSNQPAINLYKKNGYEHVVYKKNYYPDGEDAAYMVKRINTCQ